jgi:hypothetical protein
MNPNTSIFRVGLLDDLHTYFPDLLYNSGRFQTVQDVLKYIQDQARRLNPFDRGQELYNTHYVQAPAPVNEVITPTPIPVENNQRSTDVSGNTVSRNTYINNLQNIVAPTEHITTPTRASSSVYNPGPPLIRRRPIQYSFSDSLFNNDNIGMSSLASLFTIALNQPFTDVLVVPTADQVNNATSVTTATSNEECAICQENMATDASFRRINRCRHTFHQSCIDTWFQSSVTCPICRVDIRE